MASTFLGFILCAVASPAQQRAAAPGLTLSQAVAMALKNNPAVIAADAYAEAVSQGIGLARASRYPYLDFSEGFSRGNNPVYVFGTLLTQRRFTQANFALPFLNVPPALDNFRTQFAANMPLYDAGQTTRKVRDARLDVQDAQQRAGRTRQEVIFDVIHAYLNGLLAQESVGVAESWVKSTGEDLARAQARQEQGQALLSDVLSAQVQLAQAKEELIRARNGVAIAQGALNVAMGLAVDAPNEVQGTLGEASFESGTLADREQRALAVRPDYQQALIGKEKAGNALSIARAEFLPTLKAFGSWELDNQTFTARGGNNWTAGATLNFNLFDGGARRARVTEGHARERQAEALRARLASTICLQVREAFLNLTATRQRVDVSRQSASQAGESLRILQDRYGSGLATITDVLAAETAHAQVQRQYLEAIYDYRTAYAALELATGELGPESPAVVR